MIFQKQLFELMDQVRLLKNKEKIVKTWSSRVVKAGISEAEFCRGAGVPAETFSRWTNGIQVPSPDRIKTVEAALKKRGV